MDVAGGCAAGDDWASESGRALASTANARTKATLALGHQDLGTGYLPMARVRRRRTRLVIRR